MCVRTRLSRISLGASPAFLVAILAVVIGSWCEFAAADVPSLSIPEGVGPLPDFRKGAKSGVFVTREHIDKYRPLFPRELSELIARNEFACEVALNSQRPELYDAAPKAEAAPPTITAEGGLSPVPGKIAGLIFRPIVEDPSDSDQRSRAYEVLWNVHSALWAKQSSAHGLMLSIFKDPHSGGSKIEFSVERVYPQSLGVKPGKLESLFREKISGVAPQVLSPLKWLTLRFVGDVDDYVWVSSPITTKTRQLTGSNRSDLVFAGAFTPDDLFVWSGKVEYVEPTALSLVPMLVPVLESPMGEAPVRRDSCERIDFSGSPLLLNAQSHRFQNGAAWIPTNVRFVVRAVWKVDLTTKDPFSLDARQTLYVDAGTSQPIYRSVWGHDGRLRRFVLGVLGSVIESGTYRAVWGGELLFSPVDGGRSVLVPTYAEACSGFTPGRTIHDFDPSTLASRADNPEEETRVKEAPVDQREAHLSGE
jgi:hypothetical protein